MTNQEYKFPPLKERLKDPIIFFLSLGGIGFLPKAPGTWGTLATFPFFYLFYAYGVPPIFLIPPLLGAFATGCLAAQNVQRRGLGADPSWVVVDEAVGLFCAYLCLPLAGQTTTLSFISLILFRFFDIIKIWPISIVDQKMKSGLGVMLDDVLAGLFAGILTHAYSLLS